MLARMTAERALSWARWGALLLCLSTGLVALTQEAPPGLPNGVWSPVLTCVLSTLYGVLLFNLLARPSGERSRPGALALLMALSLPLTADNLAALNLFALPFAIRGRHGRWLGAQAVVFSLHLGAAWLNLADPATRQALAAMGTQRLTELAGALLVGVLQALAWHAFAYVLGGLLRQLDHDRRALSQANAELRASQTMLAEATRLDERLRLSRELHDATGHHLTSLGVQLEIVASVAGLAGQPALERARLLVRLLLAEVRDAASAWREERSTALPEALRQLLAGLHGPRVTLELAADLPACPPAVAHALFRCAQEALTNVLRHARAESVTVALRAQPAGLELVVRDDGVGAVQVVCGAGLRGLRERVEALQGQMTLVAEPGRGFTVRAVLPLHVAS